MLISSKIKNIRTQQGLSQKKLAEKAGVSQMAISLLERNSRGATIGTLANIAKALGCCIYDVFEHDCPRYGVCSKEGKHLLNCCDSTCI